MSVDLSAMKAMLSYSDVWLSTQGPKMAFSGMSHVVYTLVKMSVRHCWTALASPSHTNFWELDSSISHCGDRRSAVDEGAPFF